ncbi:hypothetical protein D3C71_775460 [compost metagenome]
MAETSTSPNVSSAYGSICQKIDIALPPSITTWMPPTTIQARPLKAMPAVIRRSAVGSKPKRRRAGYSTRLLNGIRIITSSGFSACICEAVNQLGICICWPCSTQVEAFWSNSEKNGVVSAKMTSTRSTERTPSTASAGCWPRARSSCSQVPPPMPARIDTSARHRQITMPSEPTRPNEATASTSPTTAMTRPGRPWPATRAVSAVRTTLANECGSFGGSGTST